MNLSSGSTATKSATGVSGLVYAAILPWNLIGILTGAAAGKRKRLGAFHVVVLMLLTGAMTGCGVAYNATPKSYQVTLTAQADGAPVQTATFEVVMVQKAPSF